MAPESITQDRIYNAIKADYQEGLYRPGSRIDLQAIADRHRASTTPVREAIHRLIGERLVEPHGEGGFQLAVPDAERLIHLYAWYCQQVLGALHLLHEGALTRALEPFRVSAPAKGIHQQTERVARVFEAIANATKNLEIAHQIAAGNERLHYVRRAEGLLFPNIGRELLGLTRNGKLSGIPNLRRRITAYHDRRILHAGAIADALRRVGPDLP